MKHTIKVLAALALMLALLLSLAATAEELEVARDDGASQDTSTEVFEALDEIAEMPEEIGDLGLFEFAPELPADEPQSPAPKPGADAPEAPADLGEPASNASELPTKLILGVKEKYTIPTSGLGKKLTYTSSKPAVATVSKKGVITAKKTGKTRITIFSKGVKKASIVVTVRKAPTKVTLNKTTATLTVGDTLTLKAKLPSKSASYKLTWKSSNSRVVKVDKNGTLTAVKAGKATITVKTFNGKTATCKVTVKKAVSVWADTTSVSLDAGEQCTVVVTCLGVGDLTWSVADSSVATCRWGEGWNGDDTDLYIIGVDEGSTVVTVTDNETGDTAKIKVKVTGHKVVIRELYNIYLENIYEVNALLDDKLVYYEDDFYTNGYFGVTVDDEDDIVGIILSGGSGKYTLMALYPGESYSAASSTISRLGWDLYTINSGVYYYTNDQLNYTRLCVKFTSGQVEYVALLFVP